MEKILNKFEVYNIYIVSMSGKFGKLVGLNHMGFRTLIAILSHHEENPNSIMKLFNDISCRQIKLSVMALDIRN